jgi:hypothetical protein
MAGLALATTLERERAKSAKLEARLRDVTAERDAAQRELERTTRTLEAYQRGGVRDLHRQDHLDRALGWAVAIIAKAHRKTNFDAALAPTPPTAPDDETTWVQNATDYLKERIEPPPTAPERGED